MTMSRSALGAPFAGDCIHPVMGGPAVFMNWQRPAGNFYASLMPSRPFESPGTRCRVCGGEGRVYHALFRKLLQNGDFCINPCRKDGGSRANQKVVLLKQLRAKLREMEALLMGYEALWQPQEKCDVLRHTYLRCVRSRGISLCVRCRSAGNLNEHPKTCDAFN
jgi:hypothetical protein